MATTASAVPRRAKSSTAVRRKSVNLTGPRAPPAKPLTPSTTTSARSTIAAGPLVRAHPHLHHVVESE